MDNHNPNHQLEDNIIASAMTRAQRSTEDQIRRVEDYTRTSPLQALGIAVAAGYVLRSLPVFALTGFFLRLVLILVRPFMLIFGAVNLYQFFARRPAPRTLED